MKPPTVDDARALGKRFGTTHLVIVAVDANTGEIAYASYGVDRARCQEARKLADGLFEKAGEYFSA